MARMRFTNEREFQARMEQIMEDNTIDAMAVIRKIALDIFAGTVRKTPTDTGLLKNSWFIGVNADPEGIGQPGGAADGGETATLALSGIQPGDTVIIINNVQYAPYVEAGTDKMAPRAMLRRSIQEAINALVGA